VTLLVTGGAGFIGSAVVRHLVRHTAERVVTVDALTYAGDLATLDGALDHPRHAFEQADVRDAAAMRRIFATHRPDGVLHLAAESHVDRSIDGPADFVTTNVMGTFTVLEEARRHWEALDADARARFRVVHVSTDEVFGALGPDGRFDETSPYRPTSPYAASKAGADHLARAWHQTYGLPVLVTNCTNNYGPYQFPEKLIPLMILSALEGRPLPVYGDGAQVRDWLHVEDHAEALVLALRRGVPGETYALGAASERRNLEVVRQVCRALDALRPDPAGSHERLVTFVADRPAHDRRYAIDASRARRALGWQPRRTFEEGLESTVRWYLERRDWWERIRSGVYRGERLGLGRPAVPA
jgi:dTDP-glucose 4,6-dehydratase